METLKGIARNVRLSTEIQKDEDSTTTSYTASFEIEGTSAEIKLSESITLESDDQVILAGKVKNGLFKALAYNNVSKNVSGKDSNTSKMVIGIIFIIIGFLLLTLGIDIIIATVALLFAAFGVMMIWLATQSSKAHKMVISDR